MSEWGITDWFAKRPRRRNLESAPSNPSSDLGECEPCGFLGVTSPAVDVAGWDSTPVCKWHTVAHWTDRPITATPQTGHSPVDSGSSGGVA